LLADFSTSDIKRFWMLDLLNRALPELKHILAIGLLLKEAGRGWYKHRAQRLGASLAFYTTLALAPLSMIAIAVAGYFYGAEAARGGIVEQIEHLVGKEGAATIEALIQKAGEPRQSRIATVISVGLLLFGATGVFAELKDSLDTIWEVKPKPGLGLWMMIKTQFLSFAVVVAAVCAIFHPGHAFGQTATTAGAVTTPYPTSQAIAIEWAITGDSNANGVVTVRYRANGASAWTMGMALVRVPAGSNTTGTFGSGGQWSNKHAGSLFDLEPAQLYDIELTLTDPDGGSMTAMTTVGTRGIPGASANAPVKPVTPSTLSAALSSAMPADILLLGPGSYPAFTVTRSGSGGQPIVIRGESVDTVIIGGRVTMNDRQYIHLENVTVMGEVRMNGASNMVVRGCRIRTTAGGITFEMGNAIPRNNTIVDNDIVGGATWIDSQLSADGYDGGEGIQFTGSGHEICFNHVANFRDDISFMEYDEATKTWRNTGSTAFAELPISELSVGTSRHPRTFCPV
jgi:hypothetical protein